MEDGLLRELLRRRLELVARLSLATSQLQRWRQTRMAADMDAQRCEAADGAAQELQRELQDAMRRSEEAETSVERCEALLNELEQSLAEIDGEIAGTASR
jgi:hypothetical protein